MFGADINQIAIIFMVVVSAAGVAWVLLQPYLSGEARVEKRMRSVQRSAAVKVARRNEVAETQKRRKAVKDSLSEVEAKQRERSRPPLKIRLQQAGLGWTPRGFLIVSLVSGATIGLVAWGLSLPLLVVLSLVVMGGLGLPHWLVSFLTKRRKNKFLDEFPNAVDIIVRGVKAGLPSTTACAWWRRSPSPR
jgi:tight adherence protein B